MVVMSAVGEAREALLYRTIWLLPIEHEKDRQVRGQEMRGRRRMQKRGGLKDRQRRSVQWLLRRGWLQTTQLPLCCHWHGQCRRAEIAAPP